jgi:hypothetical protein
VDNEIYGYLVDWKPAWEAEKDFDVVYHFNGKQAHYWIGTDNASILRADALSFAVSVHENKCRIIHIDLSEINNTGKPERSKGVLKNAMS